MVDWGVVIVAVVALIGSVLTQQGVGSRIRHEREMRLVEERIRIANQFIEVVTAGLDMVIELDVERVEEGWPNMDRSRTLALNSYRTKAMACSGQIGGHALDDVTYSWNQAIADFGNYLSRSQVNHNDFLELFKAVMDRSGELMGSIGQTSGVAIPASAPKRFWQKHWLRR